MANFCRVAVLIVLTACSVLAQDFEEYKGRTWTSGSGKTIDAELVSYKYGNVTLKSPDGKIFKIPITALVAADREYIKQAQSPDAGQAADVSAPVASAGEAVGSKDARSLPTLSNGSWTQMWNGRRRLGDGKGSTAQSYAIYRHPKFEARIDQRGEMFILFLKDGKPLDGTLSIRISVRRGANDKEGQKVGKKGKKAERLPDDVRKERKLIKFTDFPEPSENPSKIIIKGIYEDDVPWECTYEFKDNTVTYCGKITSRSDLEYPAGYWMNCVLSPSHEFGPKVTIDEQRRQTAHCSLTTVTGNGKETTYNYTSPHKIGHTIKSEEIKGHFKPYTVRFDAMDDDNLPSAYCYPGVALYNGSSVRSDQDYDISSGTYKRWDRSPKVRITID